MTTSQIRLLSCRSAWKRRTTRHLAAVGLTALLASFAPAASSAQEGWNPFGQLETAPPPRKKSAPVVKSDEPPRAPLAAMDGRITRPGTNNVATPPDDPNAPGAYPSNASPDGVTREPLPPPVEERARGVERGDLAPVVANDGSGLPYELWRGLDVAALEGLIGKLEMPPRSPAIHSLWRRLITANVTPPDGAGSDARFDLIRADALYRSGLVEEAAKVLAASPTAQADPVGMLVSGRMELGLGHMERGCELSKASIASKVAPPKVLRGDALLMAGICAANGGNPAGAGLFAEIAREEKLDSSVTLAALDAVASGQKVPARGLKTVSLLQYRAFALAGGVETKELIEHGEPSSLAAVAADKAAAPAVQVAAAEAAARANALTPDQLADVYRTHGAAASAKPETALARAALFASAEAERTPLKKVRMIRALLDDAKRNGLYLQTLAMVAKTAGSIQPLPEIGWFAETGIEIALATGDVARARQWSTLGGSVPGDNGLRQWQGLIDIADPAVADRSRNLALIEDLATKGRLAPDLLHRLATVLDANDINVPIPLWEAASRAPQPTGGYLPETGVLSALQDASKKKEFGRTVLLVMRTLGPNGAEGANIIALGDSIRALRRAGLDADARRLSIEALFAQWPRSATN